MCLAPIASLLDQQPGEVLKLLAHFRFRVDVLRA
ncbi:MAG: hypothetical protein ACI9XZ_004117, partial [Alphaproteobacteria bacterium]